MNRLRGPPPPDVGKWECGAFPPQDFNMHFGPAGCNHFSSDEYLDTEGGLCIAVGNPGVSGLFSLVPEAAVSGLEWLHTRIRECNGFCIGGTAKCAAYR